MKKSDGYEIKKCHKDPGKLTVETQRSPDLEFSLGLIPNFTHFQCNMAVLAGQITQSTVAKMSLNISGSPFSLKKAWLSNSQPYESIQVSMELVSRNDFLAPSCNFWPKLRGDFFYKAVCQSKYLGCGAPIVTILAWRKQEWAPNIKQIVENLSISEMP